MGVSICAELSFRDETIWIGDKRKSSAGTFFGVRGCVCPFRKKIMETKMAKSKQVMHAAFLWKSNRRNNPAGREGVAATQSRRAPP
mmetsp:Transcript_53974/g.161537  ORF Transcript_53974/g.161537 Transcript_53974/m.161537 type:complete len:86 (-) Transcript_53974:1996-2253(-)